MKRYIVFLITFLTLTNLYSQSIEPYNDPGKQKITSKNFLYALPQTSITVTIEATRTTIQRGKYAEYAQRYLKLSDVPMKDTSFWSVTDVKSEWQTEADPTQLYLVSIRCFPKELQSLFSLSANGMVLDMGSSAQRTTKNLSQPQAGLYFDPYLVQKTSKEKIDTLYKTLMTDTAIVKVPIFKKQIQAKTKDDYVKEAADELIKTRKRKLKILRGEYDFHPDGAALKVMIDELGKYERQLMELFAGKSVTEKQYFTFTFVPKPTDQSLEICRFTRDKGIFTSKTENGTVLSLQLVRQQEPAKGVTPVKSKKILYMRAPIISDVSVMMGDKDMFTTRIPIYQFGPVMMMPVR